MMMTSNSSKRRKVVGDATCPLYDLIPGGILEEVANYLAPISRALFAIAIAPPSSPYDIILARCRPKISCSSIAGSDWHTLDFGDIEKELAAKLSDDDISKILLHIDAAQKVKRLRLTNCINISGSGLASLRHSISIEQIDLSLVEAHKSPILDPVPPISCDKVVPIIESIISQERNSLKHLQFPHVWRHKEPVDPQFFGSLQRYNEMMENRGPIHCLKCNRNIYSICMELFVEDDFYGIQDDTCGVCTKNYCHRCSADDNHVSSVCLCRTCERVYCSKCSTMVECGNNCDKMYCEPSCLPQNLCASSHCSRTFCNSCRSDDACRTCGKSWCVNCNDCMECDWCNIRCCVDCSEKDGVNGVHSCDDCENLKVLCDRCRVEFCESSNCKSCAKIIQPVLLKETKKLQDEIKSLKHENKELKDEYKEMRRNMDLARMFLR